MLQTVREVGEAEAFVREYVALLDEGWQPDLEEYIRRIPEPLQEEVFRGIDEATANRAPLPEAETEPEAPSPTRRVRVEFTTMTAGPVLTLLGRIVPKDIRRHWLGELALSRREAFELGLPRFEVDLLTAQAVLQGLAQRAPLQMGTTEPDNGAARPTWLAWRLSGPLLLAGTWAGLLWPVVAGGTLLVFAWTMLFLFARTEPMPELRARAFNGIMGGCMAALAVLVVPSLVTALAMLAGLALGVSGLVVGAAHALALVAALALCGVTVSGWVPEPWQPRRLVRV